MMVAFFTSLSRERPPISTRRLVLMPPSMAHFEQWVALRMASRAFLAPFEPLWPADDLTRAAFRQRVKRYRSDHYGYAFLIFTQANHTLVGGITLSRVMRGVAQSCSIGYWIGEPHIRQGYMHEAITGLLPEIFERLRLHRLEAACMPHNQASVRVLEKAGFQQEGYARDYLKIAGQWQDHLLFALLEKDYKKRTIDLRC